MTPDLADALYAAGCADGTPGTANGVLFVDFHREAATLEDAIRSAIEDVRTAGYEVTRLNWESADNRYSAELGGEPQKPIPPLDNRKQEIPAKPGNLDPSAITAYRDEK